jgi:hypothetical protein
MDKGVAQVKMEVMEGAERRGRMVKEAFLNVTKAGVTAVTVELVAEAVRVD